MLARAALAGVLLLACAGCTERKPRGPGPIVSLKTDAAGLSGLSQDERGVLWSVGEGGDFLLRIDPETFAVTHYAVEGCPPKTDLEALAWAGDMRFVIGTETQEAGRTKDTILHGRIEGDRFVVGSTQTFDYTRWQLSAPDNHGIEGLCHVDGVLVLATELIDEQRGRRWAPVGMFDFETQTWTAHRVGLTTKTGKLAALSCRVIDGAIIALAVERHFSVSRVLRFTIPHGPEGRWIEPKVAADLSKLIEPLPNFEGLVWSDDGSVVLVSDNKYRGVAREPSRLFFIPASVMQ